MIGNFIRRFTGRPIQVNGQHAVVKSIEHGPTYEGENVTRDYILGRNAFALPSFALVPDLFEYNNDTVAAGATLLIVTIPTGGAWLVRVQRIGGASVSTHISMGDLDLQFGWATAGADFSARRGPTPLFFQPGSSFQPIDMGNGGIFFKQGTRFGIRAEIAAGNMEAMYLFSFATRNAQIASKRIRI